MTISIDFKKVIKEVIATIPFLLAFGYFILWFYLDSIGQLNLLPSILDDKGPLFALIISFTIISLGLIFTFSLPSMVLCQILLLNWNNELSRVIKISRIPLISCSVSILFISSIMIISFISGTPHYIKDNIFIITLSIFSFVSFFMVHFLSIKRNKAHIYYKKGKVIKSKNFIKMKCIISAFSLFSGMTAIVPLSFILRLSTAESNAGVLFFVGTAITFVFISYIPAIMFFTEKNMKSNIKNNIMASSTASLSFFFILMLILPNFSSLVVRGALKNIGIIESEAHIYSLNRQSYTNDMFPTSVWNHVGVTNKKYLFIKGTIIFSLGNELLICPEFVIKAQNKYRKYNFDNLLAVHKSDFQNEYLKQAIKSCALIRKPDITKWDGAMDGINTLNL
ncbi:hypothetical protein ACCW76_06370 [Pantoea sp. C8B4]|uniref:hypothetical protein n=1 Tax=Pantoea sp. C8B4 TaxID=3243083 RepID=UPI003EDAC234